MMGYMSVLEAAKALGIGRIRVVQLIKAGILEAEKIGRSYVVKAESVERRKANNPGAGRPPKSISM